MVDSESPACGQLIWSCQITGSDSSGRMIRVLSWSHLAARCRSNGICGANYEYVRDPKLLSAEDFLVGDDENGNNLSPNTSTNQTSPDVSFDAALCNTDLKCTWSVPMVKLLLSTFKTLKDGLEKGQFQTKKMMHRKICEEMKKYGHKVTSDQVQTKLRNLETLYKKKQDNEGPCQFGAARWDVKFEDTMEPCSKKKRYSVNVVMSESQRREKYHLDILSRRDEYIRLKSQELNSKMDSKKKELEIKQESTENFFELKEIELALKAQKMKAKYSNFSFDLPKDFE
ncbi:hypothetical protein QAD02_014502 [Eretmocerus hayati]|uniref:Uncharacterized protein n=1 Tax=Eretmocerus hayati TaxID=131215 RepID=A0ACC2P585_9HYME|nr:hypothetical protein QAD02_014502 [Eretmocerus hayati]